MTFMNQIQGNASSFAVLIPVPQILGPEDVKTADESLFAHLRDYTEPRLVEYQCQSTWTSSTFSGGSGSWYYSTTSTGGTGSTVDVITNVLVGSYEVVVLSAEQSTGLIDWLNANGYATSSVGKDLLQDYIDSGSYFFAAKVALGATPDDPGYLEPLQVSYDYPGFGLPIRLGTLNSGGCDQDLVLYFLTDASDGRVSIDTYPEVSVQDDCIWDPADFASLDTLYEYEFSTVMDAQPGPAWITEYGWPSGSCDPCTTTTLSQEDATGLGYQGNVYDSYTTRLHLRYDPAQVTQELTFSTHHDSSTTQQRFIQADAAQYANYPVCVRGWKQDPTDCDGNPVAPGGPGPYLEGALPPPPPPQTNCPLFPNDPVPGTSTTTPAATSDTMGIGAPDEAKGGCGCDAGAGGGSLGAMLLALVVAARRPRR
jgi:hypothetical protein